MNNTSIFSDSDRLRSRNWKFIITPEVKQIKPIIIWEDFNTKMWNINRIFWTKKKHATNMYFIRKKTVNGLDSPQIRDLLISSFLSW